MYFKQPPEIAFWLGNIRAFVNPPMSPRLPISADQFVYRADQAIRINREALLDHYPIVLRNVVRLSGLPEAAAHAALQEVMRVGQA